MTESRIENENNNYYKTNKQAYYITLSSFLWGYAVSVLNVCITDNQKGSMLNNIKLSELEQEYATSLLLIGAWIGSISTGYPTEIYGRRPILLFSNFLFISGGLLCALAYSVQVLFIGRFVIGLACGVVTIVVPCLLSEIAPDSIKGKITSMHQLLLTVGTLSSLTLGYFFISLISQGWRYLNGIILAPSIAQILLYRNIPESPSWTLSKKKKVKSYITKIYNDTDSKEDLLERKYQEDDNMSSWKMLQQYRTEICIGCILVFFQAMTGINTVILYSAKIFQYAGIKEAIAATAIVGFVNVAATLIAVIYVDIIGRIRFLLSGTWIMTLSLFSLSGSLLFLDHIPYIQGLLAVLSTLFFVAGFAIGLGAVVWVVLADLVPTPARALAMSVFMTIAYACNIFIASCTLTIIGWLGRGKNPQKNGCAKVYLICCFLCLLTIVFVKRFVRESKFHMNNNINEFDDEKNHDYKQNTTGC